MYYDKRDEQDLRVTEANTENGEHVAKMHLSRIGKLAQLTHRKNILKELMEDDMNADEVKENMDKYKTLLDGFKEAHMSYHASLYV